MVRLLSRSDELLLIGSQESCLTYREWFDTLETLAVDRYWSRVPSEQRCTHIVLSQSDEAASSDSAPQGNADVNLSIGNRNGKAKSDKPPPLVRATTRAARKKKQPMRVEEIIISSTDSSSEEAEDACTTSVYHSGSKRQSPPVDSRSVVSPPAFEMDGKTHLKDFLVTYERYFHKQFNGDLYDKSHMLSTFLSGDLLRVHEIKGGRKTPYDEMKCHLLEYYKKKKLGGKSFWRKELMKATPDQKDNYEIYGMRLTELAKLAYPEDKKECALRLRQSFLQSMPSHISRQIEDAENTVKISSAGKAKYLPFSSLVEIARDMQMTGPSVRPKTVMWASQPPEKFYQTDIRTKSKDSSPQQHAWQQDIGSPRPKFGSQQEGFSYYESRNKTNSTGVRRGGGPQRCTHCHIPGHHTDECWRKLGSCLICGMSHFIENYPKYDPQYRSRSQSRGPAPRPLNW
jgi:hypothetical protein